MKVFYSRCSTEGQSHLRQLKDTEKGFDYILSDTISGTSNFWERPNGKQIRKLIDEGKLKELHIHSIDRFGRSTLMVLSVWKELTELGIRVVCRNPNLQNIDETGRTDPFSQLLLEILSSMSSFEKSMIDMRRSEGIERTKLLQPWKYSGRKIGTTESIEKFLSKPKSKMIIKDLENGYTHKEISFRCRCSFSTIDKVKRNYKPQHVEV